MDPTEVALSFSNTTDNQKRQREDNHYNGKVKRFKCEPCERYFKEHKSLLRHQRENKKHRKIGFNFGTDFLCSKCEKGFSRAHDRDRHFHEQHSDGKIPCAACGKSIRPNIPHKNANGDKCYVRRNSFRSDTASTGTAVATTTDHNIPFDPKLASPDPPQSRSQDDIHEHLIELQSDGHHENTQQLSYPRPDAESPDLSRAQGTSRVVSDAVMDALTRHLSSTSIEKIGMNMSTYREQPKAKTARRLLPCGICHMGFEMHDGDALVLHLSGHFKGFNGEHWCAICEISFVSENDLNKHKADASKGDCGFRFLHSAPCPGHHRPQAPASALDGDRFNFLYRLRTWEQYQLKSFISSLTPLVEHGFSCLPDNKSVAWTEHLPRTLCSDDGGPRSEPCLARTGSWSGRPRKTVVTRQDVSPERTPIPEDQDDDAASAISIESGPRKPIVDTRDSSITDVEKCAEHPSSGRSLTQWHLPKRPTRPTASTIAAEHGDGMADVVDGGISAPEAMLMQAIHASDLDTAILAIACGADVNAKVYQRSYRPLQLASCSGDKGLIMLLIEAGADADPFDFDFEPPWTLAVQYDHFEAARLLLQHSRIANATIPSFIDAIVQSIGSAKTLRLGLAENIGSLLDEGASVDAEDPDGNTALELMADVGDFDAVRLLLEHGANVHHVGYRGDALSNAVFHANLYIREALLDAHTPVSGHHLKDAIQSIHIAEELLDIMIGQTPQVSHDFVLKAVNEANQGLVELLLRPDINVEVLTRHSKLTASVLYRAMYVYHPDIGCRRLIARGVGANDALRGKNRQDTLLYLAATKGFRGLTEQLLQNGAKLEAKSSEGRTALAGAVMYGHYDVVQYLMSQGANVNAENDEGHTPLCLCNWRHEESIIFDLVAAGASYCSSCVSRR